MTDKPPERAEDGALIWRVDLAEWEAERERAALARRVLAHVEAAIANVERDPASAAVMRELLGKAYAEEHAREMREKSGPQ